MPGYNPEDVPPLHHRRGRQITHRKQPTVSRLFDGAQLLQQSTPVIDATPQLRFQKVKQLSPAAPPLALAIPE